MIPSLKQFVPSEVCLKCDGCCRYKQADSVWRPKLGQNDRQHLGTLITAAEDLDQDGYIKTIQACGQHLCRFLNGTDNTCGIYAQRPFECSLYPFILSQTHDAVKVYAHLSCPYVQDHQPLEEFDLYVAYLKSFFSRRDVREFLMNNKHMFHDYTVYAVELLHLFDLSCL
jgi:Fe-S-cluster containining protein